MARRRYNRSMRKQSVGRNRSIRQRRRSRFRGQNNAKGISRSVGPFSSCPPGQVMIAGVCQNSSVGDPGHCNTDEDCMVGRCVNGRCYGKGPNYIPYVEEM